MQDDMVLWNYMRAFELPSVGKTRYCQVLAVRDGAVLGYVKWFGRWRQYTFQPMPDTVFNGECLGEIIRFLRDLNKEHREGLRRRAAARHQPERV